VLVKRYLAPSEFIPDETWRLVEWCQNLGADEFAIDCLGSDARAAEKARRQFEKALKPFSRGEETRERMSGRTVDDLKRTTELWELNPATIGALKIALPAGLFQYEPWGDTWFEDPVIYREGRLMFGVLSHEAFGVLSISEVEAAQLQAAGFPNHESLPRIG
jgi:hypothetical protein